MARMARLYAQGVAQLVHARYLNVLSGRDDIAQILDSTQQWLGELVAKHHLALHGWVLLDDGFLLLATPSHEKSMSQLVQSIGRNLGGKYKTGPIFNGRYRSALVESGDPLINALIWLETYVARHKDALSPEFWPWSSAAIHTGVEQKINYWLSDHATYWSLGNTPFDRQAKYKSLLQNGLSHNQVNVINKALSGQWAIGSDSFLTQLEHTANRRVSPRPRGRPRKTAELDD